MTDNKPSSTNTPNTSEEPTTTSTPQQHNTTTLNNINYYLQDYRKHASDKSKYKIIDPNYKRPKVFELWEKFTFCNFQSLPPNNNNINTNNTSTVNNDNNNLTSFEKYNSSLSFNNNLNNNNGCRGLYRRITDLMEDSYFLYYEFRHKNNSTIDK